MDVAYKAPRCGNKVVEPGEACDCGTAEVSCGALVQPSHVGTSPREVGIVPSSPLCRLYETLKPRRHLAVVATVSQVCHRGLVWWW